MVASSVPRPARRDKIQTSTTQHKQAVINQQDAAEAVDTNDPFVGVVANIGEMKAIGIF